MTTSNRRRPWAAATALITALGLISLAGPTTTARADPKLAATTSVAPVPATDLAQALTPNPQVDDRFATFTYRSTTAKAVSVIGNFGPSNGANGDILPAVLDSADMALLRYVNDRYPRIAGLDDVPNGVPLSRLEPLARAGRLWLVPDDAPVPAMPPGTFSAASAASRTTGLAL